MSIMTEYYECNNCGALTHSSRTHRFCGGLYPHSDMDLGLDLQSRRKRKAKRQHDALDAGRSGRSRKIPNRESKVRRLIDRDGDACMGCGITGELQVDHILPRSRGGSHVLDNLQLLCEPCNQDKADRTMDEWRDVVDNQRQSE